MTIVLFWTEELDEKLRALWAQGLSMSQIAGQIGRSKNSVAGRVHRLDLPPRGSPIFHNGAKQEVKTERQHTRRLAEPKPKIKRQQVSPLLRRLNFAPLPGAFVNGCRWPMWNNTERATQRFCGAARHNHWPYCAEHGMIAYAPRGQTNGK